MNGREASRLRTTLQAADRLLAAEGLRVHPGIEIRRVDRDTLAIVDPAPDDDPFGARCREDVDADMTDDALITAVAAFARESIRRMHMQRARRTTAATMTHAPGWTMLAHPWTIALLAAMGRPLHRLPAKRARDEPDDDAGIETGAEGYDTEHRFDMMGATITTMRSGEVVSLESGVSRTVLTIDGAVPDTILTAIVGRPLSTLVALPTIHRPDMPPLAAAHARAVDEAVAAARVAHAESPSSSHTTFEFDDCTWLPFGPPPDEETARILALNHQRW